MIEVREHNPLPQRCINCADLIKAGGNTGAVCDECDYAMDRFYLVKIDDNGNEVVLLDY